MEMRKLGSSGLMVSAIGMGCMPLSVPENRPSEDEAIAVILKAVEVGITFFDTADAYCRDQSEMGHNERLIGKALSRLDSSTRSKIVVATKAGLVRPEGRWEPDGSPAHIKAACDAALKNLGVDSIDLYQFHRPDPRVPFTDSVGAFAELQKAGKIKHIGLSNVSVLEIELAMSVAKIVSVQNQFARNHRKPQQDGVLEFTRKHNMAFLPWSPLGGIKAAKGLAAAEPLLETLAVHHRVTPQQVVLKWMLLLSPHIIPIPGASRKESVVSSAAAENILFKLEEFEALND